jgi:hypothetical protein
MYCAYGHQFIFAQDREKFNQSTLRKCNRCSALRVDMKPTKAGVRRELRVK